MNYLEYYSLKENPFSISVDTRFFYHSPLHDEALVRLKHAVESRKGLAVLLGDVGCGKTTLAQRLLDELDEDNHEASLLIVIHSSVSSEWILRKLAGQLGVPNPSTKCTEVLGQLSQRLIEIFESGKRAVVLIDEAQMLRSREVMEELRGILNIESDGHKLVTIILFGLNELDQCLALDDALRQRVGLRHHLKSFTPDITEAYVRYRMSVAGCGKETFTEDAFAAIHHYSGGIPRLNNVICDNALLEGCLQKQDRVDAGVIMDVARSLKLTSAAA